MPSKIMIAIAVTFLTVHLSHAQITQINRITGHFNYEWKLDWLKYRPIEYQPAQNVKEITFSVTQKKTKVYKKDFNNSGELTGFYQVDKSGTSQPLWKLYYDNDDRLIKSESFKKGKLHYTTVNDYDETGKPLRREKINADNTTIYKNVWVYDTNGCFTENILYKKGGHEVKSKLVNEYLADCKLSKMTLYNAKGKIKEVRSFDCDQEGEKLEKKKNETQVCRWEKLDENILTKSYQSFDEDGKTQKTVIKYLLPDTLILEWTNYDDNNRIKYKSTYDKSEDKQLSIAWYRKGKPLSEMKYEYNDDLIISKSFIVEDRTLQKTVYTYHSDQLLAELKVLDKKERAFKVAKMEYVK